MWNLTDRTFISRPLKASIGLLVLCLVLGPSAFGQSLTKLRSIPINASPAQVSIDRQGHFYIASSRGDIDKYNSQGDLLYHFSPPKAGNVTLIEAWQGLRVFCYYQDFQQYLFLDRFLNNSEYFDLSLQSAFSPMVTISVDDNLWLLDARELSLKKIDLPTNQVIIETPFNLNLQSNEYNFSHIREYQNRLYISDPNQGILVFDRFGNFLETLPLSGVEYFGFVGNELFYLSNNTIQFVDVYRQTKREIGLPDLSYKFVLMENSLVICFANNKVDLYQIN